MRRAGIILLALVASGRLAVGCSSDTSAPATTATDAGTDVSLVDAGADRAASFDAMGPDPTPPPGLPDGWVLDKSYANYCGFYVPKSSDKLPAPITWEPCPTSVTPPDANCRLMAVDAEPGSKSGPGGAEAAWVKPDGTVVLGAYRSIKPNWYYNLFAEADGPVHAAILATDPKNCSLAWPSIFDGRYAMRVYEFNSEPGGGLIAGDLATLGPKLGIHLSATSAHTPFAGPFSILDLTAGFTFDQYAWDTGAPLPSLWSAAQDNGLQQGIPIPTSGAVFWPSDNLRYQKTKVYTPSTGVRDFLTAGMVTTRGYDEFGTDGTDMVWIDAQGRSTETGPYDTLTIMTAPFTTEPSQIVARRLRTEEGPGFGASHFFVGCGFAARSNGAHIRVVRLSDGVSWKLLDTLTDPWGWSDTVAVTCTELFATVHVEGVTRLARVRLDSLGPGIPPD